MALANTRKEIVELLNLTNESLSIDKYELNQFYF